MHKLIVVAFKLSAKKNKNLTDEQVIERIIASQDPAMVEILYQRYAPKVYRKCISFVKEDDIAENLTHDIFIKVYLNLASFKRRSKFSTWLYSITYNFCIDYLRKSKKQQVYNLEDQKEVAGHADIDSLEELKGIELKRLKQLLEMVKPEEKMILLMKYREEMSIKEIQEVFQISESAVKMRIKRAKEKVRHLYESHYEPNYA
ncbi:MAG: RNA polymerase sigma factor [Chitinophagales bacterium]